MAEIINVGIVDFNLKRMDSEQAAKNGIPEEFRPQLGDWRQYPFKIGRQLPEYASWFAPDRLWFFKDLLANSEKAKQLNNDDVLILSASGLSAFKFQEGLMESKDTEQLKIAENVIKEKLGNGGWVLGICFGGQMAIHAVGGKIDRLPKNSTGSDITEAGWLSHSLTDAGKKDEVFGFLPDTFSAPHFHNDFITELPIIGSKIQTTSGELVITKTEILAVRHGYLDENGLKNKKNEYIMASVVEFDNGAKIYQIQPHPEMATSKNANFLVRMNPWMKDEMGETYYNQALQVPENADFSVANVIKKFVELADKKITKNNKLTGNSYEKELEEKKQYLID